MGLSGRCAERLVEVVVVDGGVSPEGKDGGVCPAGALPQSDCTSKDYSTCARALVFHESLSRAQGTDPQ